MKGLKIGTSLGHNGSKSGPNFYTKVDVHEYYQWWRADGVGLSLVVLISEWKLSDSSI